MSLLLALGIGDVTPPIVTVTTGPTRTKISRVSGANSTDLTFTANEDYQAYQVRRVSDAADPVTAGALVEAGAGASQNVPVIVTITDTELVTAGGTEGPNIIKVFVQDIAGNWAG